MAVVPELYQKGEVRRIMFSKITKVIIVLGGFLALAGISHASSSPNQTVQDVISVVKSKDSYLLVDYVYWPSAFKRLSNSGKKNLRINSPEDFRSFSYKFLKNPNVMIDARVSEYKSMMPGGNNSMLAQPLDQIGMAFKNKVQQARQDLRFARYEIVDTKNGGDRAVVTVKSTLKGKVSMNKVNLVLVNGRWLLADVVLADNLTNSFKTLPQLPQNMGM